MKKRTTSSGGEIPSKQGSRNMKRESRAGGMVGDGLTILD